MLISNNRQLDAGRLCVNPAKRSIQSLQLMRPVGSTLLSLIHSRHVFGCLSIKYRARDIKSDDLIGSRSLGYKFLSREFAKYGNSPAP